MKTLETLQDVVERLSLLDREPALIAMRKDRVETWSRAGLLDHARQLAAGFTAAGLAPGSHALLFAPSRPEWLAACFGLILAGAVPVPVDTQMTDEDLTLVLHDSQSQWVFTTTGLLRRLEDIHATQDRKIVLLDVEAADPASWQHFLSQDRATLPIAAPEDRAVLFYTSGTSGPPKGVPLTHRNIVSNIKSLLELKLVFIGERILLPLPLHHVYPFAIGIFIPLASGGSLVLPFSLTGPQILRAMQEGKANGLVGVPRLLDALDKAIHSRIAQMGRVASAVFRTLLWISIVARRYTGLRLGRTLFRPLHKQFAPNLRLIASGGSAIDSNLAWRLEGLGWEVATGYGLTETSPLLTFTVSADRRPAATGRALSGVDLRIAKPEPGASHGEVQAKGPNVFAGYHNLPERTAEVFTEDGYFKTGDLGYFDRKGFLYLVGRASSMIVLAGGENIRPENVEDALQRGPHIREAGVLEHNGKLVALIVSQAGVAHEQGQIEDLVRRDVEAENRRLPSHQRISDYALVRDPLPRTRLGKLRRHLLQERYLEAIRSDGKETREVGPVPIDRMAPEHRQLLEDPTARKVWDILCERFTDVRLAPDSSVQLDLGIDSMEWLNITLEIRQRTGADLDQEAIAKVQTVADLLQQAVEVGQSKTAPEAISELLKHPEERLTPEERAWLEPREGALWAFGELLLILNRRAMMGRYHHIRVQGVERIPRKGPILFTPNHRSLLDPPAIGAALPPEIMDRTYWAGWTGIMFRDPLMRLVSRAVRVVPVANIGGTISSLAFGMTVLRRGNNLAWFPEGSRSREGKLLRFQPGIGLLLTAQPVPVVPVWVQDSDGRLPDNIGTLQRRTIDVIFGEPVDPQQLLAEGEGEKPEDRIISALYRRLAALGADLPQPP